MSTSNQRNLLTKKFLISGMDTDRHPSKLDEKNGTAYYNTRNYLDWSMRNVPSMLLVNNTNPNLPSDSKIIGLQDYIFYGKLRILYFTISTNPQQTFSGRIWVYELDTNQTYLVLKEQQSINLIFNWDTNLINKFDITRVVISNNLAVFTDGINEILQINIESGILTYNINYYNPTNAIPYNITPFQPNSGGTPPIIIDSMRLIKRPPINQIEYTGLSLQASITAEYNLDSTLQTNNIKDYGWSFCVRFIYKDGLVSSLSNFSNYIPPQNTDATTIYNRIYVRYTEVTEDPIEKIQIIAKNVTLNTSGVIREFLNSAYSNTQDYYREVYFTGVFVSLLSDNEQTNFFDNIPNTTQSLAIIQGRLALANNNYNILYNDTILSGISFSVDIFEQNINVSNRTYKNNSYYTFGIYLIDRYNRKSEILISKEIYIKVILFYTYYVNININYNSSLLYNFGTRYIGIGIIPHSDVLTFVQFISTVIKFVAKRTTGEYVFTDTKFPDTNYFAIDTSDLTNRGSGYNFTKGDIAIIIFVPSTGNNTEQTIQIELQLGNYILLPIKYYNYTNIIKVYVDIQTKRDKTKIYFEVGRIKVYNGSTNIRIFGDTFLIYKDNLIYESKSNNSLYKDIWNNPYQGASNVILPTQIILKPKNLTNELIVSNPFDNLQLNNGINKFDYSLATYYLDTDFIITGIILANKQFGQVGNRLLVIGTDRTIIQYIGEQQLTNSDGTNAVLSIYKNVLGTAYEDKNSFGCIDRNTIVEYKGRIYWIDRKAGYLVQYDTNGSSEIGKQYNVYTYLANWLQKYSKILAQQNGVSQILALNSGNGWWIQLSVNPRFEEIHISLPALDNDIKYLPTFAQYDKYKDRSILNDYTAKTLVLSYNPNRLSIMSIFEYYTPFMIYNGNIVFSTLGSQLYINEGDETSYGKFLGVQKYMYICFAFNNQERFRKQLLTIVFENTNLIPDEVIIYSNESTYKQITNLVQGSKTSNFVKKGDKIYGRIMFDRLNTKTPTTPTNYITNKSIGGVILKGNYPFVIIRYDANTEVYINDLSIQYNIDNNQFKDFRGN